MLCSHLHPQNVEVEIPKAQVINMIIIINLCLTEHIHHTIKPCFELQVAALLALWPLPHLLHLHVREPLGVRQEA